MRLLIGFTGHMGSGKSLAATYVAKKFDCVKMSLSGKMREIASELEIEPTRDFLQGIGKFMRDFDDDVWVRYLYNRVQSTDSAIVIDDIRRKNEIDFLKPMGFKIVKILADSEIRKARIEQRSGEQITDTIWSQWAEHLTENQVTSLPVDYTIENNGTKEELYQKLTDILEIIKSER
jgi:dephospho-CoA kinase